MSSRFAIAIDGPVAAGKGTVARLVANELGFLYVDTGAMYRMTAYLGLQEKVSLDDEEALVSMIAGHQFHLRNPLEKEKDGRLITALIDNQDVSWEIRTQEISAGSSKVATKAKVRKSLVTKQQEIAKTQNVVMEGRDITFRVLPDADLKIFLTASEKERINRRLMQLQSKGENATIEEVAAELKTRDEQDMNRSVDPLHITKDAWVLDTSDLEIDEVVEIIVKKVHGIQSK